MPRANTTVVQKPTVSAREKKLEAALITVLNALGAVGKPWELTGYGITTKEAEYIVRLVKED